MTCTITLVCIVVVAQQLMRPFAPLRHDKWNATAALRRRIQHSAGSGTSERRCAVEARSSTAAQHGDNSNDIAAQAIKTAHERTFQLTTPQLWKSIAKHCLRSSAWAPYITSIPSAMHRYALGIASFKLCKKMLRNDVSSI